MASGQELAKRNLELFYAWSKSKTHQEFRQIVHRGLLNRREIAKECGFARSALDQNGAIRTALRELEESLRAAGVLPAKSDEGDVPPVAFPRSASGDQSLERLRRLESENAQLRAEVSELKSKLSNYAVLSEILAETGRVPR